jgi:hypothetical protein
VAWVVLCTFTLQSFITQTHIHGTVFPVGSIQIAKATEHAPAQAPSDREPASCPFCQAVASAGAFFTPAAPILFLPIHWAEAVAVSIATRVELHISTHNWHSRAPPQH